MTRPGAGARVVLALVALLGGFLVVTGLVRLVDDQPGLGGPALRVLLGALLLAGAALGAVVASRQVPRRASRESTAERAGAYAETVTCPSCGETNPPSARHCHRCDQALR